VALQVATPRRDAVGGRPGTGRPLGDFMAPL
jgi:hypothetical protein